MIRPNTKSGDNSKFQVAPGTYAARCYQVLHLGTVENEYEGKVSLQDQIWLAFELPTELAVFSEDKGEQPYSVSMKLSNSLGERAKLPGVFKTLTGEAITEESNLEDMIGKDCLLNVSHTKGGNAKVESLVSLPKGMKCPPPINKPVVFSYEPWNQEVFDALPQFLRDTITSSQEFAALPGNQPVKPEEEINIDDIPF